jgi:hypothetical protein
MIISDILKSNHLPVVLHILDHIKTKNLLEPVEKFIAWEWFQRLASDLISPRIEFNSEEEADKAACNFTASVASAYSLSTSKVLLSDINNHDLSGLARWLKHKQRLQKLWQETWDPAFKTAVNWVEKLVRNMIHTEALGGKRKKKTVRSCLKQYGLLRNLL